MRKLAIKDSSSTIIATNKGFTMIEILIALFVISCVMLLLLQFMYISKNNYFDNYYTRQIDMLIIQSEDDFLETKKCMISGNKLLLERYDDNRVTYEFSSDKLIRKVNNRGSEVLLYELQNITFWKDGERIYMRGAFKNDQKFEEILGIEYDEK